MILFLRLLYVVIFVLIASFTLWAATQESIFAIPPVVLNDVWFKATLLDTYLAFLTIFLWVCYREKLLVVKVLMFFAIALLGNIAVSLYVLLALYRLKPGDGLAALFSTKFDKQT